METNELIKQIITLPVEQKMLIIENTLKSIRQNNLKTQMNNAVSELMHDYKTDKELTLFTEIDLDSFYEAK